MARSIEESFYKTREWKQTSKQYKKSVNGLCEICLSKGFVVPAVIVHHKIHLNKNNVENPNISLSFDNLQAVCLDCHNKIHFGSKPKRRYSFGEDGEMRMIEREGTDVPPN